MVKIEYETKDFLPKIVNVKESEALDTIIEITKAGGAVRWVERTK